jgi:hypothetical protein
MKKELAHDERLLCLASEIKRLPHLEPPPDLLSSVMKTLRARNLSWWRRAIQWTLQPRSFTLSPLQAFPVAAMLLAALILPFQYSAAPLCPAPEKIENLIPISLSLKMTGAKSVSVIGSFNDWRPHVNEMQFDSEKNMWTLVVSLPEGRHAYAFVVDDGEILPDPRAVVYEEDGFGSRNAVLIVEDNEKTI